MSDTLASSERLALAALGVAWVVPAWWLGAATVDGQAFALGAGGLACVLALQARRAAPRDEAHRTSSRHRQHHAPSTHRSRRAAHRSPLTGWVVLGVAAFFALLLCQALNPDRVLVPGRPVGLLRPLEHIDWLPTGIAGPFDNLPRDFLPFANAWRFLLVAGSVAAIAGAVALLPRRANVLRAVLALWFVHAVVFSAFALVHNLSGSKATLWLVTDAINYQGAPQFLGKNQQAAYQVLLLAGALAAWFAPLAVRPWSALARRPLWLGLGTVVVLLGTATTRSRTGLAAAALLAGAALVLALWPLRHEWRAHRRALFVTAFAGLVALAALACLPPVRATLGRVAEIAREPGDLLVGGSYRRILHDIAWEMTLDRPWFGHGAGCYVLLFTEYHPRVPAFMAAIHRTQPNWNRPVHVYADGDWIQFTAEYGLAGTALLALPWLVWLFALFRAGPPAPATALLALGPGLVLLHGCIDFVLRNPAILAAAASLALLALRLPRPASSEPPPLLA